MWQKPVPAYTIVICITDSVGELRKFIVLILL